MKRYSVRLWLGAVLAPAIPMVVIATFYWMNTGSSTWFPLFLTFGYFFTVLFGLPVMGMLIIRKKFLSCLVGGGATSVLPIISMAMFSIFSKNAIFNGEMIKGMCVLFVSGCVGGALFWVIAFGGSGDQDRHSDMA